MNILLLLITIPAYLLSANFLEVSLENKNNYQFEDHIFYDTSTLGNEHLSKRKSFNNININGNFNEMIGFEIDHSDLSNNMKYNEYEIYFGTPKLKFFAYSRSDENMKYDVIPRDLSYNISNNTSINTKKDSYKYTFLSFITVKNSDFTTTNKEIIKTGGEEAHSEDVTRSYNLEIKSISTENLYETTKDNVLNNIEYIYPVAISKNATSWLRFYGVLIASFENYDYSEGEAYYFKTTPGTNTISKADLFKADEDTGDLTSANFLAIAPRDGRFKGFGYGYKLTAEAHIKNFSFFITSFYKKVSLKNYSTPNGPNTYSDGITNLQKLNVKEKYTSFGIKYRF